MTTVHCSGCGRSHRVRPPSRMSFARGPIQDEERVTHVQHTCDCGQRLKIVFTAEDDHGFRFAVHVEATPPLVEAT